MFATYCPACHAVVEWTRDGDWYYGLCLWCGFEPAPIPHLDLPPVPRYDVPDTTTEETPHADATGKATPRDASY
jgi:hypothetical protein